MGPDRHDFLQLNGKQMHETNGSPAYIFIPPVV